MAHRKEAKKHTAPETHDAHVVAGSIGATIGAISAAAAVGMAEGATFGALAGAPGMIAGAAVGGTIGAYAGKAIGKSVNPTKEEAYWRDQHQHQKYFNSLNTYDSYAPAYRFGIEAHSTYAGRPFDEIEAQLGKQWESSRGASRLTWDTAKLASRDAYERISAKHE